MLQDHIKRKLMQPTRHEIPPFQISRSRRWVFRLLVAFLIVLLVSLSFMVVSIDSAYRNSAEAATADAHAQTLEANVATDMQISQSVTTRVNPVDGMVEVYIPAGVFTMGDPILGSLSDRNSIPQREVFLDAYWIAQTAITNAMYKKCFDAGGCPKHTRQQLDPHYYDPDFAEHPVVFVNWDFAVQYCEWSGGRLPSEAEWEKAARGMDQREYPWGNNAPNPEQANVGNYHDTTVKVGSFPQGASPYGVLDMGSNVREWVDDWYKDNYQGDVNNNPSGPETGDKRVVRGASWSDPVEFSKVTNRLAHVPKSPGWNRGFRCAYDP